MQQYSSNKIRNNTRKKCLNNRVTLLVPDFYTAQRDNTNSLQNVIGYLLIGPLKYIKTFILKQQTLFVTHSLSQLLQM